MNYPPNVNLEVIGVEEVYPIYSELDFYEGGDE